MKFTYKQNDFELMEMVEPYKNETFGIIGVFRVKYVKHDDKKWETFEVFNGEEFDWEDYEFVNYFCNQEDEIENLQTAKEYIDEWFENKT